METITIAKHKPSIDRMLTPDRLWQAYELMVMAKSMTETYDANRQVCKYVHSTSRGHEAIQIATGLQLLPCDWLSPYYRDDSLMLSAGFTPYELMLQLLAKKEDPFSGGRSYYCHPSSRDESRPSIIHQSSATGMPHRKLWKVFVFIAEKRTQDKS